MKPDRSLAPSRSSLWARGLLGTLACVGLFCAITPSQSAPVPVTFSTGLTLEPGYFGSARVNDGTYGDFDFLHFGGSRVLLATGGIPDGSFGFLLTSFDPLALFGPILAFPDGTEIGPSTPGLIGDGWLGEGWFVGGWSTGPGTDRFIEEGNIGFITPTGNWGWAHLTFDESTQVLTFEEAWLESIPGRSIQIPPSVIVPESGTIAAGLATMFLTTAGAALRWRRRGH